MLKYGDFLLEQSIYDLMLESKIQFSDNFIGILNAMSSPVAKAIVGLQNQDKNVTQNYIDSDVKSVDMVTFIQDRRAQQLTKQNEETYKITNTGKHLKISDFKTKEGEEQSVEIYKLLGLTIADSKRANNGDDVKITAKITSPFDNTKDYWAYEGIKDSTIKSVINKEGLRQDDITKQLWIGNRNNMRVGRLIRSMIPLTGKTFTDADIETFVNEYKSIINVMNDDFSKFDVVSDDKIHHFYHSDQQSQASGTLGNSCMSGVPPKVLHIYTHNPDVCQLVILYDNRGKIEGDKYKSDKIMGRALLWKTREGDMYMDRIYTVNQSDETLFKKYAERNGWWAKQYQNSSTDFTMVKGEEEKTEIIHVVLKNWDEYFPYMDSIPYFNKTTGVLTNDEDAEYDEVLTDTWDFDEEEDNDDDYDRDYDDDY
jgi:hypothetical protein